MIISSTDKLLENKTLGARSILNCRENLLNYKSSLVGSLSHWAKSKWVSNCFSIVKEWKVGLGVVIYLVTKKGVI